MNKKILIIGGIILVAAFLVTGSYNGIVSKDEKVETAWSNVESQYQRRADLVPNLVEAVKGVSNFEQETLNQVVEARAAAIQPVVDINNVDEIADFAERQEGLSSALSRLLMISENYPELRATESFRDLQVQLEGTENRITVARMDYNEAVQEYNVSIRKFPGNLTALFFGFEKASQFEASEGAEVVPEVNFE